VAHADLSCIDRGATVREIRFPAMGNTTHLVINVASAGQADIIAQRAQDWLLSLEAAWSRFAPTSDIASLNTARGRAVQISPDTEVLIRHLLAAYEATNGLFNPFVLPALITAGYGRSLAGDGQSSCGAEPAHGTPTHRSVLLESVDDPRHGRTTWCRLLDGATLDAGGLGKGLAADIVAERLVLDGALGALVSIGGDIRCVGQSPDPDGWTIDIEALSHPALGGTTVVVQSGAIATSSTFAKRWHSGHHVIDPATNAPLDESRPSALRMSSVIASTAVWAEVFATATLVAGADMAGAIVESRGLAGRFERVDGNVTSSPSFERFTR